jgi:hypothetical protein
LKQINIRINILMIKLKYERTVNTVQCTSNSINYLFTVKTLVIIDVTMIKSFLSVII